MAAAQSGALTLPVELLDAQKIFSRCSVLQHIVV